MDLVPHVHEGGGLPPRNLLDLRLAQRPLNERVPVGRQRDGARAQLLGLIIWGSASGAQLGLSCLVYTRVAILGFSWGSVARAEQNAARRQAVQQPAGVALPGRPAQQGAAR